MGGRGRKKRRYPKVVIVSFVVEVGKGRVWVGGLELGELGGNRELCYTSSVWSSQDVCTAWLIGYRRLGERHRRTRLATRFFCLILNAK